MHEPHSQAVALAGTTSLLGWLARSCAIVLGLLGARGAAAQETPSFSRQVIPVLSRLGCNGGGSCHGTNKGQGGFRLSLFGAQPKTDFERLTHEIGARRINLQAPNQSLILLKATGQAPHGGGRRTDSGSPDFKVLHDWIAAGGRLDDVAKSQVARLVVTPAEQVLKVGESGQFKVTATYSDGSSADVTQLCRYETLREEAARVDASGTVRALKVGDSTTIIRYGAEPVLASVLIVPEKQRTAAAVKPHNFIDEHVLAKLQAFELAPAPLCDDETFLRRVYLDVTGFLPPPDDVRAFLKDTAADKRNKKIDEVLARPGYAEIWASKFSDLIKPVERGNDGGNNQGPGQVLRIRFYEWLRARLQDNVPYDQLVERILVSSSLEGRPVEQWLSEIEALRDELTSKKNRPVGEPLLAVYNQRKTLDLYWERDGATGLAGAMQFAHAFLGLRLQCAQCHRHPYAVWQQDDVAGKPVLQLRCKAHGERQMRTVFAAVIALSYCSTIAAQPPDPKAPSPEKYALRESRGHKAAMRDGVKLSVDVYRPDVDGRHPAILFHTPYNNNAASWTDRARGFARRGYVVAVSDCRGRFDSEGDWDPFGAKHKTDGYDLVEWLAKQPWCDGNVGMMGQSYMGWTQWWTATQAPPSLKAIVPEVAPPDQLYNGPYQNGILVCWMMDWAAAHAGRTTQTVRPGAYGGFVASRHKDYMELPYLKLCERRGALDAPWFETWIRDNLSTSPYWQGIAYQTPESYARVQVPSLNITGWFDANYPGTPKNYAAMKKHGATAEARRPHMVVGPWMHSWNTTKQLAGIDFGADAIINWDGYVCRWFDRWLKGQKNGVENDPPVHVFVMGRNRWHAEKDWPLPQTRWTKFYLHSGGKANSLSGDGRLDTVAPGAEPADAYTHDPADPVPDTFTNGHIDGPVDTRKGAGRQDVLVYSTPPLEEEVEVTGPIEAKLFAATSARDTDWMMRLIDVHPNGHCALLCDGVMRARCRDPKNHGAFTADRLSEIEADKVYEYTLDFWRGAGNAFSKGHRIRIEISSTFFPYYLPNPGTGEDNVGLQTRRVAARQRVLHDAEHPSHVVLPIISAR